MPKALEPVPVKEQVFVSFGPPYPVPAMVASAFIQLKVSVPVPAGLVVNSVGQREPLALFPRPETQGKKIFSFIFRVSIPFGLTVSGRGRPPGFRKKALSLFRIIRQDRRLRRLFPAEPAQGIEYLIIRVPVRFPQDR